jgi:hypothetical protein
VLCNQDVEEKLPGRSIREGRSGQLRGMKRRLSWMVLAGFLSLSLWGCGTVPATPASQVETPKSPVVAEGSMAAPLTGTPLDELKNYMTPERSKLAIAGGAALLVTFLVGVGVGKARRGAGSSQSA